MDSPANVQKVADLWTQNAIAASFFEDACYVQTYDEGLTWVVGCNYETVPVSLVYDTSTSTWAYRSHEHDSPMPGGQAEAEANARCVYTG